MAEDGTRMNQSPVERAIDILNALDPPPTRKKPISCPTMEHEDNHASAMLYPDGDWYCFGCQAWGSALDRYVIREGLSIRQALERLGCYEEGWKPLPPLPEPEPAQIPEPVREILMSSGEFALRWETAKLLALQEPTQAKLDVLSAWDQLNGRGIDIPETLKLVALIRGVALFRHANPAKAHLPRERWRAVAKLLREVEAAA